MTELKQRFIDSLEDLPRYYITTLEKAGFFEELYNKDLCNFSTEELESFIDSLDSPSINLIRVYLTPIKGYIDFAIEQGYVESKINYVDKILTCNLERFINTIKRDSKYLTKKELDEIVDNCVNAQDAVLYQLLFEGINGKVSEDIRNLKITDVDFENKTIDIQGSKKEVSFKLLELIKEAHEQVKYIKKNGEFSNTSLSTETTLDVNTVYVLKTKEASKPISPITLIKRFTNMKKIFGYDNITPTSVYDSGLIYKMKQLKENKKELNLEDWKQVVKEFKYEDHQTYNKKKELERYV